MKNFTCVVVGSGSIARRHIRNLSLLYPQCKIILVQRKESFTGPIPCIDTIVHDAEEALAFNPLFAIIANPSPFHISTSLIFADSSCHLLIEKPLSDNFNLVFKLHEKCKSSGIVSMIGYNLVHNKSLQTLNQALDSGLIGTPIHFNFDVGQYLPHWRSNLDYTNSVSAQSILGGGPLLELSHEIHLALWLGGAIKSISAHIARVGDLDIDTEDCVDLICKFNTGAIGTIHLDFLRQNHSRQCRIIGTDGCLEWNYYDSSILCTTNNQHSYHLLPPSEVDPNLMYLEELRHFLACIDGADSPYVSLDDGIQVLSAIIAARHSSIQEKFIDLSSYE